MGKITKPLGDTGEEGKRGRGQKVRGGVRRINKNFTHCKFKEPIFQSMWKNLTFRKTVHKNEPFQNKFIQDERIL